jgi:hypothetical protein
MLLGGRGVVAEELLDVVVKLEEVGSVDVGAGAVMLPISEEKESAVEMGSQADEAAVLEFDFVRARCGHVKGSF